MKLDDYLLTSIEGRISRQPFWIALMCLIGDRSWPRTSRIGERWSSIVSLLLAYPDFAVFAKRGHDRNVPTWVAGVFIAGAVVLNLLTLLDLAGPIDQPEHAVLRHRRSGRHHGASSCWSISDSAAAPPAKTATAPIRSPRNKQCVSCAIEAGAAGRIALKSAIWEILNVRAGPCR